MYRTSEMHNYDLILSAAELFESMPKFLWKAKAFQSFLKHQRHTSMPKPASHKAL